MSHLIDMSNNRANMAYVGKTPWHGLGQQINPDSTIEQWKIAAGLDWTIEKRPIAYGVQNAAGMIEPQVITDRFAHVRSDTQEYLGMGSKRFQLLQPGDTLEFYRDLVHDSRFSIETAGALNGGAKIWALARCNLDLTIGGNDVLKPYLLLATANDGSMSTVADFTTVRVVCNNTLTLAVGNNGNKASIKVPHSRKFNANEVKTELGLIDDRLETFATDADTLSREIISDRDAIKFFVGLIAKTDENGNVSNEKHVDRTVEKLMAKYRRGPGADLATAHNTLWGAVNAVTNHVDYDARARSDDNRFSSSQFGLGNDLKQLAFNRALEMVAA